MNVPLWNRNLELELVKMYKKFRCLWMIGSSSYGDLDKRYAAYVRIVEALKPKFRGLTVPMVVYKIRDLRYRYCVELTKIEKAASCGLNYKPSMSWFKVMLSFLDLRFRIDNINSSIEGPSTENSETKLCEHYSGMRLTSSTCRTIYNNHLTMENSKSTVGEFKESGNYTNVYDRGRTRESQRDHLDDYFDDTRLLRRASKRKLPEVVTRTSLSYTVKQKPRDERKDYNTTREYDEFNAFATSIGSQLKMLHPVLVAKLEVRILMILDEERMRSTVTGKSM